MTYDDAYVISCLLGIVVTIAALAGFCIDRWPDWRRRNEDHRVAANWQHGKLWLRQVGYRGTVSGRVDPSPVPRLVASGVAQQDRDVALRARAEGENL